MDWYLEGTSSVTVSALREEIVAYLRRHAAPDSDLDAAAVAVAELLTNIARHAPGPAWVSLDWSGEQPVLAFHDLGAGFELPSGLPDDLMAVGGRGLFIVSTVARSIAVAAKRGGGSKVTVELPVRRLHGRDGGQPRRRNGSLPTAGEARADGTFDRESFLRALVVQLAEAVAVNEGPDAAEAAIAQVGADVGGRMEEEYRLAEGIVGDLTPTQIADLYVRLKAAIDGDFYLIDVNERRIVLGNRSCPFGDVVRRAPGLCRMTSSVFGGIAARSTTSASVVLEERIALGDPECRVVVWLSDQAAGVWEGAHHYGAAS